MLVFRQQVAAFDMSTLPELRSRHPDPNQWFNAKML